MSQLTIRDFLKQNCGFKDNVVEDIAFKLLDQGIDEVEIIQTLEASDLIDIGIPKIQSNVIMRKAKLLQQNSDGNNNDRPENVPTSKSTASNELVDQPQNNNLMKDKLAQLENVSENSVRDTNKPLISKNDDSLNQGLSTKEETVCESSVLDTDQPLLTKNDDVLNQGLTIKEETVSESSFLDSDKAQISKNDAQENLSSSNDIKSENIPEKITAALENAQFVLFETFEDSGSEYKMSKIRLNEVHFRDLSNMITDDNLFPLAFYGDFDKCLAASYEYLGVVIPIKQPYIQEGIIVLKNQSKLALIYKSISNEIYDYKNQKKDQSSFLSTYLRYLIDLCQTIVITPDDNFKFNPDLTNPYKASTNPLFKLQQEIIVPDEKFQIQQVPYVGEEQNKLDLKAVVNSFDQSKFLPIVQINEKQDEQIIRQKINAEDLSSQKQRIKVAAISYSYDELKQKVIDQWPLEKEFFTSISNQRIFENKIKKLSQGFIPEKSQSQLQSLASLMTDQYLQDSQNLKEKLQQELSDQLEIQYLQFFKELEKFSCQQLNDDQKNLQTDSKKDSSWFDKFKYIFQCEEDLDKKLACNGKCIKNSLDFFLSYRFKEIYKEIDIKDLQNYFDGQKEKINIIRDKEYKIDSWNVTKDPTTIQTEFKNHTQNIKIKEVFYISDNSGLILIENYPDHKNSIYHFSAANKSQSSIQLLLTLGSTQSSLIIEPQKKQWCTFDNLEYRVNIGRLTKEGKIEDGAPVGIYDQIIDGFQINQIKSASFLPQGDLIFFLNQNSILFQYSWQSRQLSVVFKKVNEEQPGEKINQGVKKFKIQPKDSNQSYQKVEVTPDGKYIILYGQNILDIYDLNWNQTQSFSLENDFAFINTFTDKINNFIAIFNKNEYKCYQLVGLSATRQIRTEITKTKNNTEIHGNPIIDQFYNSFQKYGPHSDFIFSPSNTQLYFYDQRINLQSDSQILKKYFNQLNLKNVSLSIIKKFDAIQDDEIESIKKQQFLMIAMSRVPLHVATIENSTLVPLNNGKNISNEIFSEDFTTSDEIADLIQRIISLISFGIYEEFLKSYGNKKVKVVSIIGRQSSGKSYVMNRFFGTRFGVAATRCTDGVWMSVVEINRESQEPQTFMILDCEGLFSARRNEQEEMKFCLVLSAISDIMILNQDLSFNRYLNQLFTSFDRSVGRIKGKKLFKGTLMMLIRDVVQNDSSGAYQELESNIRQLEGSGNNSFLDKIFGGRLISQCLNFFQMPIFDQEIEEYRLIFLDQIIDRWIQGSDLVESFKVVLAQVFTDDDTDIDINKIKISCELAFKCALKMFYKGGEKFKESQICIETVIDEKKYEIKVLQKDIKLEKQLQNTDDDEIEEQFPLSKEVLDSFISNSQEITLATHNDWFKGFRSYIKELLNQRKDFLLNFFKDQQPSDPEFEEIIQAYQFKLKNILEIYIQKLLHCDKTCRNCQRSCALRLNHPKNCYCETDHICQMPCKKTEECAKSNNLCVGAFGHEEDHRCGEGNHKCSTNCQQKDCTFQCKYDTGHDSSQPHDCGNKHPCTEKCEDEKCSKTCQFDVNSKHEIHTCGETKCTHKCFLCERQCIFPKHLHSKLIAAKDESSLQYKPSESEQSILLDYHICDEEHQCPQKCEQPGVCSVLFKMDERDWENEFGTFKYTYFEPSDTRSLCKLRIQKYSKNHDSVHNCNLATKHRCSKQCPECKSFCSKDIDHDGLHGTDTHRNKENNVFVDRKSQGLVRITEGGIKREFKPGETCQAENCTQSCARKGRAHYHLRECAGQEKCAAIINPSVKHTPEKFYPFTDKVFDKWLCNSYWKSINWEQPIKGEVLEKSALCNFICCHPQHPEQRIFCILNAWHTGPHVFDGCDHKSEDSNIIDIVFCMDTTGSMGGYLSKAKDAVEKIIKDISALPSKIKKSIQFGFVAYRDHHPSDGYVTEVQSLTDEETVLGFIQKLGAGGGGDNAEAVIDGLNDSINKTSFREISMKFIFHIGDAPPHGRQYTNGNSDDWPDGCPCKIKIEDLAEQLKEKNIRYKLLKIGSGTNQMAIEFKKHISNYEEQDLDKPVQLEIKMSQILVKDITQESDDIIQP